MAYVTSRSASPSIMDRVALLVKMVKLSVENRMVYNRTVAELSGLSDRDLSDMGINRFAIREIAREAAYSK